MRPADRHPWWLRLLKWRLMLPLNLVLIGFVGWSYAREASRGAEISDQLASLRQEVRELDRENRDYAVLIGKLGTGGFVEREARLKLGYQKPGEHSIILREAGSTDTLIVSPVEDRGGEGNPHKWWRYFFGTPP